MFSLIFIWIRLEQEFGFGEFCKLLQDFRQLHISNVYLESEYHIDTHLFISLAEIGCHVFVVHIYVQNYIVHDYNSLKLYE